MKRSLFCKVISKGERQGEKGPEKRKGDVLEETPKKKEGKKFDRKGDEL